jgi:hypothetical protein
MGNKLFLIGGTSSGETNDVWSTLDGATWTTLASGAGETPTTVIQVRPTPAKFVRITQSGTQPGALWGIQQIRLYQIVRAQGR